MNKADEWGFFIMFTCIGILALAFAICLVIKTIQGVPFCVN